MGHPMKTIAGAQSAAEIPERGTASIHSKYIIAVVTLLQ
jgi:hypothetical protein